MSWLSKGLQKLGVSKDLQRKLTKPVGLALAPVTGGLSVAVSQFVNNGNKPSSSPFQGIIEAVMGQQARPGQSPSVDSSAEPPWGTPAAIAWKEARGIVVSDNERAVAGSAPAPANQAAGGPQALVQAGSSGWARWKWPVIIGSGALVLGGIGFMVLRRAR